MHTGTASSGNRNAHNINISMWTAQWAMHKASQLEVSITPTINYLQSMRLKLREIMMGGGNGVASVIMLTFPSEPCPHAYG